MPAPRATALAAALTLVTGCAGGAEAPAGAGADAGAGAVRRGGPTTLPPQPPLDKVRVELLDPGAEPRRRLHYQPRPGDTTALSWHTDTNYTIELGGHLLFSHRGAESLEAQLSFDGVEDGALRYRLTFGRFHRQTFGGQPLVSDEPDLEGKRGSLVVSDRGQLLSADIPALAEAPRQADDIGLDGYFFVLPEEPVGVGARWKVEHSALHNGLTINETEIRVLVELDERGGKTVNTLDQRAPPQILFGVRFIPTAVGVYELSAFSSSGRGETRFSLASPVPASKATEFAFSSQMTFREPERTQGTDMKMTTKTSLESRRAAGRR